MKISQVHFFKLNMLPAKLLSKFRIRDIISEVFQSVQTQSLFLFFAASYSWSIHARGRISGKSSARLTYINRAVRFLVSKRNIYFVFLVKPSQFYLNFYTKKDWFSNHEIIRKHAARIQFLKVCDGGQFFTYKPIPF